MDPYRAAGLERNPFVAEVVPGVDPPHWIDRSPPGELTFEPMRFVQVIGPKGAGKTSHLLRWRAALSGPYRHVGPGLQRLAPLPGARVVYWDEADRTPWLSLALLGQSLRRGMVVVGTHRDLSSAARRVGFIAESHVLDQLTASDVALFASRRIVAAGGKPGDFERLDYERIARESGASLREAGRLLHIEVARRVGRAFNSG